MAIRLNVGCGPSKFPGFINIDHRGEVADVVDDAFTLTTYKKGTVSEIVASHILEHAQFDRTMTVLKRWHALLVDGGVLWVAVPNFELVYTTHLANYLNKKITWEYFNSRIFGNAQAAHAMYGDGRIEGVDGMYAYELAFHRAVFTLPMLINCLVLAGFRSVKGKDKLPYKKSHPHEICVRGTK